jgi:hypothetical protein
MKLFKTIIASFLILTLAISCKSKIENAETKTIDSLLTALDEAEEKLEHIDFEKLEKSAFIVNENLEKIKPLIVDTLSRDKIFLMSNYAIVCGEEGEEEGAESNAKKSENYKDERERYIEKEVSLCIKQLKNLKGDFKKGEMDLQTFKKYFQIEKAKSEQIILFIEMEKNSSAHRQALFDSLHPLILKFMDSLQTASNKNK